MKIIENIKDGKINFEKISFGEVFKHNNNFLCELKMQKFIEQMLIRELMLLNYHRASAVNFPNIVRLKKLMPQCLLSDKY